MLKSADLTQRYQGLYCKEASKKKMMDDHEKAVASLCKSKLLQDEELLTKLAEDVKKNPSAQVNLIKSQLSIQTE